MKKFVSVFCLIVLMSLCFNVYAADVSPKVILDGNEIVFADVKPIILNDRTMVPMRVIFEKLGYIVQWVPETKVINAIKDSDKLVTFQIDNPVFTSDGQLFESNDAPPVIYQGRTLLPLRALAEAIGATVDWNGDTYTVTITTKK